MRIRRCAVVSIECRERLELDLRLLSAGGSGLSRRTAWVALVPHLLAEIELSEAELLGLGAMPSSEWIEADVAPPPLTPVVVDTLRAKGLVVAHGTREDEQDRKIRDTHWRPASAILHFGSRWQAVDTAEQEQRFEDLEDFGMAARLGMAPEVVHERSAAGMRIPLADVASSPLQELLRRRVTCRNFDDTRPLSFDTFSAMLQRVFGAYAIDDYAPEVGLRLLKRSVPSAGGLHPTEAYLLVQHVDSIAAGLYHYHPIDHALEPVGHLEGARIAETALRFVAGQSYFSNAHVLVVPTSRFLRNFWKYRNHAKAYRALVLDVGHLSQTLYLAATELGLGAYVTAAVNEVDLEEAFRMDPLREGPMAVCGFGHRHPQRSELEFDPLHAVWSKDPLVP